MPNTFKLHPKMVYGRYSMAMTIGESYMVRAWGGRWCLCRLIQVTRKGFNLLDLETSRCVVRPRHLYASKMSKYDEIPDGVTRLRFNVPEWVEIQDRVVEESFS